MPTDLGDFHQPHALLDRRGFDKKYEKALELAKDGVPARDICTSIFGIGSNQFDHWFHWAYEDIEAGFTEEESNLIKLILGIAKEDVNLHRRLSKTAINMAINENTQMLQFLLKTRFGYSEKSKSELEVSSKNDTPVKFEIVDMTPNEDD